MSREPFSDSPNELVEKKASEQRALVLAYKRLFARDDGKAVLADLQMRYGWLKPTATVGASNDEVVRRECMKHPLYHIQSQVDFQFRKEPKPKKAHAGPSPV